MKYILILISFIALSAKAQTWTVITNLEYKDGRINAYNSLGKQIHQVNCKDMVYVDRQNGEINIYDYKNENNNLILTNKLVSPTLASVRDSLNAWIASCNSTEKIDSIISILNSTTDSIYTLQISNGIKQLDGTVDSFNCRSVSFAWRTMATGTATITGSDGTSLIFNPLDELPNWSVSDGNKLGKIYIDATGATGLRIFYTGCENPCFKKIQAIDCTSGQPIQLGDFNDDFNDDFLN